MPSGKSRSHKRLLFVLAGFQFLLALLVHLGLQFSRPLTNTVLARGAVLYVENTSAPSIKEEAGPGLPIRLKIPKIDVDTVIEYVGVTPEGAMDMPKGADYVGWFELGAQPGDNGSAVIAGHYGRKNKKPSAFDNLHKLRKGDIVEVQDDNGAVISFVVRELRRFDPKADASLVFGARDDGSHLNLVTCEGVWDEVTNSYPKRLVVFTDKK